jgi:hypothetical protein
MSASEEFPVEDLNATEASLAALVPIPAALDRDRLMFQAGRAAPAGFHWGWPAATGILAAVAAALALVMILRPPVVTETVVVRSPVESAPAPPPSKTAPELSEGPEIVALAPPAGQAESLAPAGYLRLQEQILHWGLDALPSGPLTAPAEAPLTLGKLLDQSPKPAPTSPWWKLDKLIPIGGQS